MFSAAGFTVVDVATVQEGLSTGGIIGIVVGVILGIIIIIIIIPWAIAVMWLVLVHEDVVHIIITKLIGMNVHR